MRTVRAISLMCAVVVASALQAGVAQAAMKTQYVDYKHGNTALKGYLAYDDSVKGKRPGVLLVHYRGGLSETTLKNASPSEERADQEYKRSIERFFNEIFVQ